MVKRSAAIPFASVLLDESSDRPLYHQVYKPMTPEPAAVDWFWVMALTM